MQIDRDAAAIVLNRHRVARFVQSDADSVGIAVEVLVDGVIDDFPDEVVQSFVIDAADVHRRPAAHGLQTFEDGDVGSGIPGGNSAHVTYPINLPEYKYLRGDLSVRAGVYRQ